ncbi:hypothetical protein TNCV_1484491 [Trichonephila clavipes]|nr:hypothetical protein TNCV_1484491 [Trichonephila clavipes]
MSSGLPDNGENVSSFSYNSFFNGHSSMGVSENESNVHGHEGNAANKSVVSGFSAKVETLNETYTSFIEEDTDDSEGKISPAPFDPQTSPRTGGCGSLLYSHGTSTVVFISGDLCVVGPLLA